MPDGNLLLTLRQINICLGLYESEKLAASEMTFAQAFLLNEIFSMDSSYNIVTVKGTAASRVFCRLKAEAVE